MPGDPVVLAVTTLVWFLFFPREAAGALVHPAFPTPSLGEGTMDNSGVTRRGDVRAWLMRVIASESEAIQSHSRKTRDCFVAYAPRNDGSGCLTV